MGAQRRREEASGRKDLDEVTESIENYIDSQSRIWVIAQGEGSAPNESIYMYDLHYTLLPAYVYLDLPWNLQEETVPQGIEKMAMDAEVTHILVYKSNEILKSKFANSFSDGLSHIERSGRPVLYKIVANNENCKFEFITEC